MTTNFEEESKKDVIILVKMPFLIYKLIILNNIWFFKQELSEEIITKNLSNLGRTADGTKFAYLKLSIPGFNISDISCLAKFKEIQTLDLSNNKINGL